MAHTCIKDLYKNCLCGVTPVQSNHFCFVGRCAKNFAGEVQWVYWCSCDSRRGELVDCLGSYVQTIHQELDEQLPPCLHITAIKTILSEIDAIHDVLPCLQFDG